MDPLVAPVLAGAAGAFVGKVVDKGAEWLIELVAAHSPAVQATARRNAQNFIEHLAVRIERLEAELPVAKKAVFDEALDHPGTSLLMQKALQSAAVTENEDRHELLAELITQRLTADADDMVALVGFAACDVVNSLSSRHIRLLGLAAQVLAIAPNFAAPSSQTEYDSLYNIWWGLTLDKLVPGLEEVEGNYDFLHLAGLGCLTISIGKKDLNKVLVLKGIEGYTPNIDILRERPWWPSFERLWDSLKHCTLTTVGVLIGTLYRDQVCGARTRMWGE